MKLWGIIAVLLLVVVSLVYAGEPTDSINKATVKLKNNEILAGKNILESMASDQALLVEEKAAVNNKLAWLYETRIGNYSYAQRYSNKVLQLPLADEHPAGAEAKQRLARLNKQAAQYRKENRLLGTMQIGARSRVDAIGKIKALTRLIEDTPDYPDKAVVYHYIGKHHLYLEHYYKSFRIFSDVLKTRPGIVFLLPTETLMDTARTHWLFFVVNTTAKTLFILCLLTMTALLFTSNFWEWMPLKYLKILPVMTVLWAFFLVGGAWLLSFFVPDQGNSLMEKPAFIQGAPFSPGAGILLTIFFYGLLGILFSFLLALATKRFTRTKIRTGVTGTLAFLFFGSVFAVFYLNHCYQKSLYIKKTDSILPVISGYTYIREKDYEPLILANPAAYPNLSLGGSTDKVFVDWVKKQYAVIAAKQEK